MLGAMMKYIRRLTTKQLYGCVRTVRWRARLLKLPFIEVLCAKIVRLERDSIIKILHKQNGAFG